MVQLPLNGLMVSMPSLDDDANARCMEDNFFVDMGSIKNTKKPPVDQWSVLWIEDYDKIFAHAHEFYVCYRPFFVLQRLPPRGDEGG